MPKRYSLEPYYDKQTNRYMISLPPTVSENGRRQRFFYETYNQAEEAAKRYRKRHGRIEAGFPELTMEELGDASEAFKVLKECKTNWGDTSTLRELAIAHRERLKQQNQSIKLGLLFDEYLDLKEHLSSGHRKQAGQVQQRFKPLAKQLVSDLEPEHLESILGQLASTTRNRYIKTLHPIFKLAVKRRYAKENIIDRLDKAHTKKGDTEVFPNEVIKGMLDLALAEKKLEVIPYLALGAFAGIRIGSPEIFKLRWSDIKFSESYILIRAEIAKTKKRRFIPIPENLAAWLNVYLAKRKPVIDPNSDALVICRTYHRLRMIVTDLINRVAPKQKWIQAGLRHTYASAMINSEKYTIEKTSLALGHEGKTDTLYRHYFLAALKEQALAYWNISPPSA